MASEQQVKDTYKTTRDFYKGGLKSGNKSYYGTGMLLPTGVTVESGTVLTKEQLKRNENQFAVQAKNKKEGRSYEKNKGKTLFDMGKERWLSNDTSGNCGEMAAVAMYVAIEKHHVARDEIVMWLTSYSKWGFFDNSQFGHNFIIVGKQGSGQWCVDPWCNFWCERSKYAERVREKLEEWNRDGKRIAVRWGEFSYWTSPTQPEITGLLGNEAKWTPKTPDEPL